MRDRLPSGPVVHDRRATKAAAAHLRCSCHRTCHQWGRTQHHESVLNDTRWNRRRTQREESMLNDT